MARGWFPLGAPQEVPQHSLNVRIPLRLQLQMTAHCMKKRILKRDFITAAVQEKLGFKTYPECPLPIKRRVNRGKAK